MDLQNVNETAGKIGITNEQLWTCLRRGHLKREIISVIIAGNNNCAMVNYIKVK